MLKKTLNYPPELVAELVTALRAVPGATDIKASAPLGCALWTLVMLIGASKERDLIKAAERMAPEVGIPKKFADRLVCVAYAFVEAMTTARDKADTRNTAEA